MCLPLAYNFNAPTASYFNQMQQPMQPQQPRDGLIRVTGMDGAKAYQLPPNSAVALFDGGQDVFYVKTTDGAGFPTIRAYSFSPLQETTQPPAEYVTRQEFEALREEVMSYGKQPVSKPASTSK